jgi:hypothetical protein
MNNMNKVERNEWLMQFRLQSARRKKRMQHEDLEKKLIELNSERSKLYRQQRNLGWMELDPPVMRGWKRYFVLREDVARSNQASFFQNILDKINTVQLSDKKSFTAKKRKWGRKIQVEREQKLLQPDPGHFKRLKFSERETQFFYEATWRYQGKTWSQYVFVEPWRFILRVRPNLITKTRVRDEAIEKRINEINLFLKQRDYDKKLLHLLHGHDPYRWKEDGRLKEKYTFRKKPLQRLLDEVKAEHSSPMFDNK